MRGRKPIPTHLKLLNGNPGKRPLNQNEPQPMLNIPDCPNHLDELAMEEWERISPELFKLGLLSNVDRTALACYCTAYSRWVQAEQRVMLEGTVLKGENNGGIYQHPSLAIANKAMEQMKTYLQEFGMTPSSRSRLHIASPAEKATQTSLLDFALEKSG